MPKLGLFVHENTSIIQKGKRKKLKFIIKQDAVIGKTVKNMKKLPLSTITPIPNPRFDIISV